MPRKLISLFLCFVFIFTQAGFAQAAVELNFAGYLAGLNHSLTTQTFRPLHLRYFSYDNSNNQFKVFLDKGDTKDIKDAQLKENTQELLNYFLIGVTLPDSAFWVNLRPDAEDNIIDPKLERTDIGKVLLEADLQLKKDTASFTSPATPEGKAYWDKLYKKAEELFGYDNITIPTLTRPWIVPGEIIIRETKDSAYIYKATLKVMLEQDHLKNSATYNFADPRLKALNEYSSQIIRETIIPKLTKEVNNSKRYASLRQVYYSLVLARWFKARFNGQTGAYAQLIDRSNLTNLTSKDSWSKIAYFNDYQKSFKNGEYNIKQPVSTPYGQSIRSYFSGGIALGAELNLPGTTRGSSPAGVFRGNSPRVLDTLTSNMPGFAGTPDGALQKTGITSSPVSVSINRIADDVKKINSELMGMGVGVSTGLISRLMIASVDKTMLLNDFAESAGIDKEQALQNMFAAGIAIDEGNGDYELTKDFFDSAKLDNFVKKQVTSSSNPRMADLTSLRIERIIFNAVNPDNFIKQLAINFGISSDDPAMVAGFLQKNGIFPIISAAWQLDNTVKATATSSRPLKAEDVANTGSAAGYYKENGVDVNFSLPSAATVDAKLFEAFINYLRVMEADMARGGYNYRSGKDTKQSVDEFFRKYFVETWYEPIQQFVIDNFNGGKLLKVIVTNGIGANDQFMWALARMYNENRPEGAPIWIHVAMARDLAKLAELKRKGIINEENVLFIDISRSGGTWEGVEVAIRSLGEGLGFKKHIAVANGGAVEAIARTAASLRSYNNPLIIGMSPDIGGRNMHRKTTIYYTALTVAGMFLPTMDSTRIAVLNDKFDKANDFATPEESLAVSAGQFLFGAMRLFGAEHIAFMTNTESLRLVATEWEQYIMEGSNKTDVISMGIHDLSKEPAYVLRNFAEGPATKMSVGMAILDKSAPTYDSDLERAKALEEKMPLMIFTINSKKAEAEGGLKGGISPTQQAAFDILWTDMVTVFTTLLRVDANSNPNVKLVRRYTRNRVATWRNAAAIYAEDDLGREVAKVLVSYGTPGYLGGKKIGFEGVQIALTRGNAKAMGQQFAQDLTKDKAFLGRNRLNLFVGRDDLMNLVSELRNDTYKDSNLVTKFGWIPQTALFPLWSHKGLEANLAHSTDSEKPLLANKTVEVFFNARSLGEGDIFNQQFDNQGIMNAEYAGINGATIHQTNDAMTIPNIKRMAEVSPTILFEFNDMDSEVEDVIKAFYGSFISEMSGQLEKAASSPLAAEQKKQAAARDLSPVEKPIGSSPAVVDQVAIERVMQKLATDRLEERLQALFGKTTEEIERIDPELAKIVVDYTEKGPEKNRLGWSITKVKWLLENPDEVKKVIAEAEQIRDDGFENVIIGGMGGSGLAVQTVKTTFATGKGLNIYSLRTTDPAVIADILREISLEKGISLLEALRKTKIVVISKSATTRETNTHKDYFEGLYEALNLHGANIDLAKYINIVTDEGSPWTKEGKGYGRSDIQLNGRGDIGGRFTSPTTRIFLLPLALSIDRVSAENRTFKILKRALEMNDVDINKDVFFKLAAFIFLNATNSTKIRDKVTLLMPEELRELPLWAEQLFEESLGKEGKGVTLFYGENLSPEALQPVLTNDRVFLRINLKGKKTNTKLWDNLTQNGYPVFEISVEDVDDIGGLMLGLQRTVAAIGYLWKIGFVDQPAVNGYKNGTNEVMNRFQAESQGKGRIEVSSDWRSADFKNLKLYYEPLIKIGAVNEEELRAELVKLWTDLKNAPAVYAAILNILSKKPGFEITELTSYGRMTPGLRSILQNHRSNIFTRGLKMPTKLGEGPDKNHSYQQNIEDGRNMFFSTYFMPLRIQQPSEVFPDVAPDIAKALVYDDNLLRAQTIGTVESMIKNGRKVVLITANTTTLDAEKEVDVFFIQVDGYLKQLGTYEKAASSPVEMRQLAVKAIKSVIAQGGYLKAQKLIKQNLGYLTPNDIIGFMSEFIKADEYGKVSDIVDELISRGVADGEAAVISFVIPKLNKAGEYAVAEALVIRALNVAKGLGSNSLFSSQEMEKIIDSFSGKGEHETALRISTIALELGIIKNTTASSPMTEADYYTAVIKGTRPISDRAARAVIDYFGKHRGILRRMKIKHVLKVDGVVAAFNEMVKLLAEEQKSDLSNVNLWREAEHIKLIMAILIEQEYPEIKKNVVMYANSLKDQEAYADTANKILTLADNNGRLSEAVDMIITVLEEKRNAFLERNKGHEGERPIGIQWRDLEEYLGYWRQQKSILVPEYVVESSASSPAKTGGIDFRQMAITCQPMGSFTNLNFNLPKVANLDSFNLEVELGQIKAMVSAGIIPSAERIKEYVAACYAKGELKEQADELVACLAQVCKLEEAQAAESKPELKEVLVILDAV